VAPTRATMRANHRDMSNRGGQGRPILARCGRKRLTAVLVAVEANGGHKPGTRPNVPVGGLAVTATWLVLGTAAFDTTRAAETIRPRPVNAN
jgi:hypothetical protein